MSVPSSTPEPSNVLRVYLSPGFPYAEALFPENFADYGYTESSLDAADVVLKTGDSDALVVERRSELMHLDGVYDFALPMQGNWHRLPLILGHIAHFHFFLEWMADAGSESKRGLVEGVQLKMFRVAGKPPAQIIDASYPDFLQHADADSRRLPVARIPPDADAKYGFEVHNTGDVDLYSYLFFFDPETYHIFSLHGPRQLASRALVKSGQVQRIGFGEDPVCEFLPEDDKPTNSGFLKLFVSTEPLNLHWIESDGLLKVGGVPPSGRQQGRGELEVRGWDTMTAVVTMTESVQGLGKFSFTTHISRIWERFAP